MQWRLSWFGVFLVFFQEKVTFLLPSKDKAVVNSEKAALVSQVDSHTASHSQHHPHRVVNKNMFKGKTSKEGKAAPPNVPYKPVNT